MQEAKKNILGREVKTHRGSAERVSTGPGEGHRGRWIILWSVLTLETCLIALNWEPLSSSLVERVNVLDYRPCSRKNHEASSPQQASKVRHMGTHKV